MSAIFDPSGRTDGRTGVTMITPEKLHLQYNAHYNTRRLDSSNESFNDLSDRNARIYLHLVKAVFPGWNFKTAQSAHNAVKAGGPPGRSGTKTV